MEKRNLIALGIILCTMWAPGVFAQDKSSEPPPLVGRISFIEGQLLRFVYAEKDWVATVKDAPIGVEDAFYSNDVGRAEFKLPNNTWVRVGSDTQVQLTALREDVTEVDVGAGTARFYDKGRQAVIKATTPYGYVVAQPGTTFDIYVGDESAEVISLDGQVDFILGEGEGRYTVAAGGASIISDGKRAMEGDGTVETDWDEWNLKREQLWTERIQVKGDSISYLPPSLADDAYALDQQGRWERVYYQGAYRTLWRPTTVSAGWQPFTEGRWTVWNEDNCWIPEEEFGYVTHHYGNWVYANSYWYWAPPVKVRVGYPGDRAYWYPGRVAWIYSGATVGWVPLAPAEIYYSYHHWGPAAVVVGGVGPGGVSINIGRLAYVNQAVIVNQSHFYGVNNYYNVRIASVNRAAILSSYRAAPVVNGSVIGNYNTNRNRFVYNMNYVNLSAKPHQAVLQRIDRNRMLAEQHVQGLSAKSVQQGAAQVHLATPLRAGQGVPQIEKPRLTGRIVPENQVNRPGSELEFHQRQLKPQGRLPRASRGKLNGAGTPLRPQSSVGQAGNRIKGQMEPKGRNQAGKLSNNQQKMRFQKDYRGQRNEMRRQERLQRQQKSSRDRQFLKQGKGAGRGNQFRSPQMRSGLGHMRAARGGVHAAGGRGRRRR